ncbi:hypothetical protein COCON_G00165140 [Conger conger]|uniref:Uncharacterized protein n=1 Tax=Conger conger TaxID=82655 RepID=A0A9Q1D6W4_CONCO|nr:hypothetical protein COCON_G00165140 [Conger conger]
MPNNKKKKHTRHGKAKGAAPDGGAQSGAVSPVSPTAAPGAKGALIGLLPDGPGPLPLPSLSLVDWELTAAVRSDGVSGRDSGGRELWGRFSAGFEAPGKVGACRMSLWSTR